MSILKALIVIVFAFGLFTSCAPVKFSKADNVVLKPACEGTSCDANAIVCAPRINGNLATFTYATGGSLPAISSQCNPSDVDYTWVVKRADASVVTTAIPGLSGMNPQGVNFTSLGAGSYYVFLTASKTGSGLNPYNAATPLEFIVPGMNNTIICDPKLNGTLTSLTIKQNETNPAVAANCSPLAGNYIWTATKNGTNVTIPGLSGASSTPNITSLGVGTYRLYLYATLNGSGNWQTTTPLTVTVTDAAPPVYPPIQCSPRINGSLTSLTITGSSPNPLISANCLPSQVQYTWTVTKNGVNTIVPNLAGANSNPNFYALGRGTYLIYLMASNPGNTAWNTTQPLVITVDGAGAGMNITCAPRLNGQAVSVTVPLNGTNPVVTANCTPPGVTYLWTVTKAGQPVTVAGLAGASSTGQFTALGLGTYLISLTASAAGYNTFVSPSPLQVQITEMVYPYRNIVYEKPVSAQNNKVDILMVFDDSASMLADNTKLAQRLQNFVNDLTASGIDWQMCATVTRDQNIDGTMYWGASRNWVGYLGSPLWILKTGAADPYSIFTNTVQAIGAGWAGSDDERGIKAAWWHAEYAQYNKCYRTGASLAVIMISDEDERSVGGDQSAQVYEGEAKTLEPEDQPQSYIAKVKQMFGEDKKMTFNSIIVKPADTACTAAQDAEGSKSHYGYKYAELSQLTNGGIGSICATDYSSNLYYFKDRIISAMASVELECAPVGDINVTVTPSMGGVTTSLQNNTLLFNPAVPAGRTIKIEYKCAAN